MNILFIEFLITFLFSLGVLSVLIWAILKKKVILRDLFVSLLFSIGIFIFGLTCHYGYGLNDELSTEFKVIKERVSYINYQDSVISDSLLYSMINNLRIPHSKIVFAQAKLESANYKSELYNTNFNLFGMKYATKRPTITSYEHMGYQRYANWKESVVDYLIWQLSHNVDKLNDNRYFEYLHAVYAEDPNYVNKLKTIIFKTDFEKLSR